MHIGVPSGIGDISWLVSKVINAPEWGDIHFVVAGGWPYRAGDYLKMLDKGVEYGQFDWGHIVTFEQVHPYTNWSDVPKNYGVFYMEPNILLESKKLAEYLPDLPTSYHYHLNVPNIKRKHFYSELVSLGENGPLIGISAASYRGAEEWKCWDMAKWADLCKKLVRMGYSIVLMGGSWDDLTRSLARLIPKSNCLNLVGETDFAEACAIHKLLDYYIGFSSGLGIIRTVLGLPTFMLWPNEDAWSHGVFLRESWADPADVQSGRYVSSGYWKVSEVLAMFKGQISAMEGTK